MMNNSVKNLLIVSLAAIFVACGGGAKKKAALEGVETTVETKVDMRYHLDISDSIIENRQTDTIDLGRMGAGEILERKIYLRNTSDLPMVIIAIETSCGCAKMTYPRSPVKPGDEVEVTLRFDSKGLQGSVRKFLSMTTSLTTQQHTFVVLAEVKGKKTK